MSTKDDDWRIRFAPRDFHGIELIFEEYEPYSKTWEHEHCILCNQKIAKNMEGADSAGYRTVDATFWVCRECVTDLADHFQWKIQPA